jgi:hypothetical protein
MRELAQGDLLSLWETGRLLRPLDRGVLAIEAAFPEVDDSIADWPIGRRNRALAEIRCALFGTTFRGWTTCRQCVEQLEFQIDGARLAAGPDPARDAYIVDGELRYRLPTTRDLAAVASEPDPTAAARRLVQRCCVDESVQLERSEEQIESIGQCMAAADPLAEILLRFDCPSCGASFDESLDLTSFLWTEIEGQARRVLRGVHTLAAAYGWTETQILALSQARRDAYLELVGT